MKYIPTIPEFVTWIESKWGELPAPAVGGCCMKFGVKVLAAGAGFMETAKAASCKVIDIAEMAEQKASVAVVDKNEPAAIFFTGGTTGAPKGAVLPHRALMRGALNGVYAPGNQLGCQRYASVLPTCLRNSLASSTSWASACSPATA